MPGVPCPTETIEEEGQKGHVVFAILQICPLVPFIPTPINIKRERRREREGMEVIVQDLMKKHGTLRAESFLKEKNGGQMSRLPI